MPKLDVRIRWLIDRDHPEVIAIESQSSETPWTKEDLKAIDRTRNWIGMVAEDEDRIVGWMLYELHETRVVVLKFAVDPFARRLGVGTAMINKLKGKCTPQKRPSLVIDCSEDELRAHLFFKKNGLKATEIVRGANGARDIYRFCWVAMEPIKNGSVDDLTTCLTEGWA